MVSMHGTAPVLAQTEAEQRSREFLNARLREKTQRQPDFVI